MESKPVNTKQKQIILIHGMWMSGFTLRSIGNQLVKKGWQLSYFNYSSMFTHFEKNVDDLYTLWNSCERESTHMVGHSLGGLLVLAMIEKYQLTNLPRTIVMGSPVNGSAVAKKLIKYRFGRAMLGKSAQVLVQGRENILQNKIGVITGTMGIGIGHLIQSLPKPHDGVVATTEATLTSAEDSIALPVTHASMLFSRKISTAIDQYLSAGRFG